MQTALSSKRSWIARIAVLAMVASLMAFGAAPAGAVIDTSGACPETIPSAGFTDLAGVPDAAVDAIDCVAFYEISQGTSATTFSPFNDVERWQMALFLTRQAEVHGVTLPDGSDQGFTDLAGVPAAAVTAINQTAQLNISLGTSATTFSPFEDVERWQMALFLTRLVDAAGVTLPDGSDQGFTDLAGVPAAAVTAINQLAQLEISEGTTATTFDPFSDVARWQMALFLTRTLQADGITPPSGQQTFVVTPSNATTVVGVASADEPDTSDDVQFTVSNPVAGATHSIELYATSDINADGEFTANTDVSSAISVVNGGAQGTPSDYAEAAPVGGTIVFTVDAGADFESIVAVVFADEDGDNALDTDADGVPTEPYGISGVVNVFPPEAADGGVTGEIIGVFADENILVVDTGAGDVHLNYDDNDDYYVDATDPAIIPADAVTMAQFEAEVSVGDDLDAETSYNDTPELTSVFALIDDSPAPPTLAAVDGEGEVDLDITLPTGFDSDDTITLQRATVNVGADTFCGTADDTVGTYATIATLTTADDEVTATSTVIDYTSAVTPGCYSYRASATVDGEASGNSTAVTAESTADVTAPDISTLTAAEINNGTGSTSAVIVTFSEAVATVDVAEWSVYPTLQPGLTIDITSIVKRNTSGTQWTINLSAAIDDAGTDIEYTVETDAAAYEDAAGNEAAADTDTFDY